MIPTAWHCPACNAYHAPHVDTCPKATQAQLRGPATLGGGMMKIVGCACDGTKPCGNAACPYGLPASNMGPWAQTVIPC